MSVSLSASKRWRRSKEFAPAQVALAWLLQKPGVVAPIVGASKAQHLADALASLQVRLPPEVVTLSKSFTSRTR